MAIKDLVKIKHVKSADNTADIMTKALLVELHDKHSGYLVALLFFGSHLAMIG